MISIIIPVYNTEKYIEECIKSLLEQTYDNYEIIIINDCSLGNIDELIKNYNSSKITYIKNKHNMGIGYSRNLGIKKSKGEYICFIDSDDYVDKNFLQLMYDKLHNDKLDLVVCDYNYVENEKITPVILKDFQITNLSKNPELLVNIPLGPCNKIVKKSIIVNNDIKFSETLKYEDVSFVASLLYFSKKIGKVNKPLNYFRVHELSETTTRDSKVFDIFEELNLVKEIYKYDKNEYLNELIISILFNYSIQQRYQKDKNIRNNFIDSVFKYLEENKIDYKNNKYIKSRGIKGFIESHKNISKIYCSIYSMFK